MMWALNQKGLSAHFLFPFSVPARTRQPRRSDFFEPMFAFANEAMKKLEQRGITGSSRYT
jgi:hypothetical protein